MNKKDRRKLKEFAKGDFWTKANEGFKKAYIKWAVNRAKLNEKDRRVLFNILFDENDLFEQN